MGKTAVMLLRQETHYRSDAFMAGLKRHGYEVRTQPDSAIKIGPDSLLVLWNRKAGREDKMATAWERCGARVVIAENGYIGKDSTGHQYYAMALGGHNGSGKWHVGGDDRFAKLGIELAPWRRGDGYILLCGQRGIGSPTMASPPGWHLNLLPRLKGLGLNIKVRNHPGDRVPQIPLEKDLDGAAGALIWSSSSGVKALAMGIPVCYAAPHWVCAPSAIDYYPGDLRWHSRMLAWGTERNSTDRLRAFRRMAWAQWTLAEIASGEAFDALLDRELNS